jgi:hypothetical protein
VACREVDSCPNRFAEVGLSKLLIVANWEVISALLAMTSRVSTWRSAEQQFDRGHGTRGSVLERRAPV